MAKRRTFASAKKIRLSINFDPDHNSSAPPLRLPLKSVAFADEIDVKQEVKVKEDGDNSDVLKVERVKEETIKHEPKPEASVTAAVDEYVASTHKKTINVKEELVPSASNGSVHEQNSESDAKSLSSRTELTRSVENVQESSVASPGQVSAVNISEKGSRTEVNEDNSGEHTHPCVVAVVGSKKRTIIDDDSSDSSDNDTKENKTGKQGGHQSSSPPRKKRKASFENSFNEIAVDSEKDSGSSMKPCNPQVNGLVLPQGPKTEKMDRNEADSSAPMPQTTEVDARKVTSLEGTLKSADVKNPSLPNKPTEKNEAKLMGNIDSIGDVCKNDVVTDATKPSVPELTSPTDPAAAPETFDITCESCKKSYDMRYVDPPLVERPSDEWRCFECLVNDARGWPRRRKSTPKEPFSPRADSHRAESLSKKRGSSSKSRNSSSSSKKSKKSSSKSRSSSSSKKKSSSSSKRKSSSKSSSKKPSTSSSSKKHKKRKSSSSSSHHHSSSHSHHRRRHHSHHHHEDFAKLVGLFRERQEQRLGIEEARIKGDLHMAFDEAPQGWRVVSSTLDELRGLIESVSGGSLEQDRLRGRLILILKDQEKLEEQRRKQQELAWNILPRRQSSRIAIGRMKNQSVQDYDVSTTTAAGGLLEWVNPDTGCCVQAEDGYSDDDAESRRPGLRSRRSHPDGADGQQKHDRAWRARRRHQVSDDDIDLDDDDDELDGNGVPRPGNWIDWSLVKGSTCCLSTVCLALVNRLLKEEASDVELVWQNCRTFNAPDTMVVQFADLLSKLSRSMCNAAEKKGVDRMKDKGSGGGESGHDSDDSSSDASKAESRSSVNKAWTESSASESSESSDGDSSSDGGSGTDAQSRKQRSARTSSKKPQTRLRSTRSNRTSSPATKRASRSTRSRSSKKRPAPTSSSEVSSPSEDEEVVSPVRKNRRPLRGSAAKPVRKLDPPTEEEDSSDDDSANNRPSPPQNGAASPSPPPPPPPSQAVQKRPKPRLIISDSSSSDDSSDSDGNSSSSSSSSDSDGSDSDTPTASSKPQPPPPSSGDVPAPPPPSPPPPAASPVVSKPPVRQSPGNKANKPKTPAAAEKKKLSSGKTTSGYTHSPPLLNSYLSPSSSSSSDFSSDDSDSSDGDSDSD
ncbi:unnamed protein product [Phytophthora fragariaefolia]|uniref:Unnamed protein product n=1 Tax=Phytophthora fragariaefolia TaxID=1490495 RepID=A0A9W7CVN9_9STRA|nr:unnamed protein product [Phytophthora fragariaefolia]